MRYQEIFEKQNGFEAWFNGSKVINPDGSPKKMYHGTGSGDISSFDYSKANRDALYGPGFYFTDNPNIAGGDGGATDWEEIDQNAIQQKAGYAFIRGKFAVDEISEEQTNHIFNYVNNKQKEFDLKNVNPWVDVWKKILKDCNDIFKISQDTVHKNIMEWASSFEAPEWMIKELGIKRERISTPAIIPVYLSIKNPFYMNKQSTPTLYKQIIQLMKSICPKSCYKIYQDIWDDRDCLVKNDKTFNWIVRRFTNQSGKTLSEAKTFAVEILQKLGYDGIHHSGGLLVATMGQHDVWIAFKPNQIKSIFASRFNSDSDHLSENKI